MFIFSEIKCVFFINVVENYYDIIDLEKIKIDRLHDKLKKFLQIFSYRLNNLLINKIF